MSRVVYETTEEEKKYIFKEFIKYETGVLLVRNEWERKMFKDIIRDMHNRRKDIISVVVDDVFFAPFIIRNDRVICAKIPLK